MPTSLERLGPLHAIVDVDVARRAGWTALDLAAAYLNGGARLVQVRAKSVSGAAFLDLASRIGRIAHAAGALVIVNDRADIARLSASDGVHVGQDDLAPSAARAILAARGESLASHRDGRGASLARRDDQEYREYLREEQRSQRGCIARRMQSDFHHGLPGPNAVIGLSTHTETQIDAAISEPVTYIAVGPVFETSTKATGYEAVGLDRVRYAARHLRGAPTTPLPRLVAIGGITLDRAVEVLEAGADAVAVITDLIATGDPERRVRAYLARLAEMGRV